MSTQGTNNECYELDLEELTIVKNGEEKQVKFKPLEFTQKNKYLILACIKIDSTYRRSFDENNSESSAYYISEWFGGESHKYNELKDDKDKEAIIYEVCRRLDNENSTHLSVSSMEKDVNGGEKNRSNSGIDIMAKTIVTKYPNILQALEDDEDGKMVVFLSECVKDQIRKKDNGEGITLNKLSFASKFCTYMCRYAFDEKDDNHDKYSIYDSVLCNILPYYVDKYKTYVHENLRKCSQEAFQEKSLTKSGDNSIEGLTKKNGYKWYRCVIDGIRNGIKEKDHLEISREDFDSMLWYYYKGDSDLIAASYAYLKAPKK